MTRRKQRTTAVSISLAAYERDVSVVCSAADLVVSLPPASQGTRGNRVTVLTGAASTGTGTSISPATGDKIQGTGITAADNKDLINTAATDAVGDAATLVCDGVDGWWIENLIGTWARET